MGIKGFKKITQRPFWRWVYINIAVGGFYIYIVVGLMGGYKYIYYSSPTWPIGSPPRIDL